MYRTWSPHLPPRNYRGALSRALAGDCPKPPSQPRPTPGLASFLLKGAAVAGAGILAYKGLQAILDEDFETTEFPAWFRRELIEDHIARYGSWCPWRGHWVHPEDLTVDHIVALVNGGRTSRANAQVLCGDCNSAKGARNSLFDFLRGRAV